MITNIIDVIIDRKDVSILHHDFDSWNLSWTDSPMAHNNAINAIVQELKHLRKISGESHSVETYNLSWHDSPLFHNNAVNSVNTNLQKIKLNTYYLNSIHSKRKLDPTIAHFLLILLIHRQNDSLSDACHFIYMAHVDSHIESVIHVLAQLGLITYEDDSMQHALNAHITCSLTDFGYHYAQRIFKHPYLCEIGQDLFNVIFKILPHLLICLGCIICFCFIMTHINFSAYSLIIDSLALAVLLFCLLISMAVIEYIPELWITGNRFIFHSSSLRLIHFLSRYHPDLSYIDIDPIIRLLTYSVFELPSQKHKPKLNLLDDWHYYRKE